MTYSLRISPYQAALLDGAARSAGLSLPVMLALRAQRITSPATGQHSPAPAGGAGQGTPAPSAQPEYTTETPNLTC